MLVLSRKVNEEIQIGPDVTVMVVSIKDHYVKLGVKAPPSVVVLRPDAVNKEPPPDRAEPTAG